MSGWDDDMDRTWDRLWDDHHDAYMWYDVHSNPYLERRSDDDYRSSDDLDESARRRDEREQHFQRVRAWWDHLVQTGQADAVARWGADPRSVYGPLPRPIPPPHPVHDVVGGLAAGGGAAGGGLLTRERTFREVLYFHDLTRVLKPLRRLSDGYTVEDVRLAAVQLECEEAGRPFHRPPPTPRPDPPPLPAEPSSAPRSGWRSWWRRLVQAFTATRRAAPPPVPPSPPVFADTVLTGLWRPSWNFGSWNR